MPAMTVKTLARKLVTSAIGHFGYEMRMVGSPPCGYATFLRRLTAAGLRPRTVFDVGVGDGTPWLYDAFPGAHFVLIEPQAQFEPCIQRLCAKVDAEYHLVGAGSFDEYRPIFQLPGSPTGSSFLEPNARTTGAYGKSTTSMELHIVPLDSFAALPGPYVIKIDTEGFELAVVRGATKILEQTDVVLMEVAVAERQIGELDLIEIGVFMKGAGFRLMEFPELTPAGRDGPLLYVDVAFCKVGSAAWSAPAA